MLYIIFLILFLLLSHLSQSDDEITRICNLDRECYFNNLYCDNRKCNLICNGTQSCLNLNYKCNSTHLSSICNIICNGYQSCKNINIYSNSNKTIINCISNLPSCINSNINCNNLQKEQSSKCIFNCQSQQSCQSLSYYSTTTTTTGIIISSLHIIL